MRLALTALTMFASLSVATAQETALPPPPPLDAAAVAGVMRNAVDGFIRPGYRSFAAAGAELQDVMQALCAAPSTEARDTARAAFDKAVSSWANIEIVRVGPVIQSNRFERILFYPDRKSLGLRQVQALLAKPTASIEAADLAGKSVALQGFGALEYVLFADGSDQLLDAGGNFRCLFGAAVATNIRGIADEVDAAWAEPGGIARDWTTPGPDNPEFRTPDEAATALLGILVHGAEALRDQRVEGFYKGAGKTAFPRQALFWRSGNSFTMIRGNLAGLQALFDASGLAGLMQANTLGTADSIDFLLNTMQASAARIDPDIETALSDPAQRSRLDYLIVAGKDLILRFNDELGGALGLSAGFSFQDGD